MESIKHLQLNCWKESDQVLHYQAMYFDKKCG